MLVEVESSRDDLRAINVLLRSYWGRMQDILQQVRRKQPIKEATFEEEFKATVLKLRALADNETDFWNKTRAQFQVLNKGQIVVENRLIIKQINCAALEFTRQTDELFTVFKNLQAASKELPLRLNWWVLESASDDLSKVTSRILFLVRDLEKRYD